jgi:hypothetical protein
MKKNLDSPVIEKISSLKPKKSKKSSISIIPQRGEFEDSIELMRNIDILPNVEILEADRHSGHNNFTAIKDVVDNPMDPDVNAKNVWVDINYSNGKYISVRITDDGLGISPAIIDQVFKGGSKTGRDKSKYLGGYGKGLKTAALSLGRRFEIRTKSEKGPFFVVEYDYDRILDSGKFIAQERIGTTKEYCEFMKATQSETGTIVTISRLDRMKNNDVVAFISTLKHSLGMSHFYFITKFDKHIFVNGEEVVAIDPIARDLPEIATYIINENFEYNGHKFTFSVYNIPRISLRRSREVGRSKDNAGLYIFRNNRLVGEALNLGITGLSPDGHGSGIRIEFFMSGDCDELFGSTYIKIIKEANKYEIDQSFRDACKSVIQPYVRKIRIEEDLDDKKRREQKTHTNLNKEKSKNFNKKKIKREKPKNAFLEIGSMGYCIKNYPLDLINTRVEETISTFVGKTPQRYGAEYEKLVRELTCLELSPPKNNEGDAFLYSKSIKFDLDENRYITTRTKKVFEKKISIVDKDGNFSIDRIKPTQDLDYYVILLVDVILPDDVKDDEIVEYFCGVKKPKNIIGYFYCLTAAYVEKSEDFKRPIINGTIDANINNQDPELKITIKRETAFQKFKEHNLLRDTSFTDLREYLYYLNNDEIK